MDQSTAGSVEVSGVVRRRPLLGMVVTAMALVPVLAGLTVWMGAPWVALGMAVCGGGQLLAVLLLLRSGRELAGRVVFLVCSYVLIVGLGATFGAGSGFQYYLFTGIGMPFLFLGPERPRLRLALSLVAVPIAVGLVAWQAGVVPWLEVAPSAMAVLRLVNDLAVLLTAGLMYALFSRSADSQLVAIQSQERALEAANSELRRANDELDGFARVVSHDLKTPIAGVLGLVELLQLDAAALAPPHRELVDHIAATGQGMLRLVTGVLDHARAGEAVPVDEVDPDALLDAILRETPDRGLRIVRTALGTTVRTRETPLRQVLANLVSNAVKYHDKPDGRVWVEMRCRDAALHLVVRDDGPGIPVAFHDQVFSMFGTVPGHHHRDSTGVGLATVKKLVEQAGGTIALHSVEGQGARFEVVWPVHPAAAAAVAPAAAR